MANVFFKNLSKIYNFLFEEIQGAQTYKFFSSFGANMDFVSSIVSYFYSFFSGLF